MMQRRNFLKALIGGIATTAAVRIWPFRVYSFPSDLWLSKADFSKRFIEPAIRDIPFRYYSVDIPFTESDLKLTADLLRNGRWKVDWPNSGDRAIGLHELEPLEQGIISGAMFQED